MKSLINIALNFREWISGFLDPALPWLYGSAIAISLLLIWGIIFFIVNSGYINYRYEYYQDLLGFKGVSKKRQLRVWKQILKRYASEDPIEWKAAVVEADKVLDEILKMSGYKGDSSDDRFAQVTAEILPNIDKINEAHKVKDRIFLEPDFVITKEETRQMLQVYQQAFKHLGLLD